MDPVMERREFMALVAGGIVAAARAALEARDEMSSLSAREPCWHEVLRPVRGAAGV